MDDEQAVASSQTSSPPPPGGLPSGGTPLPATPPSPPKGGRGPWPWIFGCGCLGLLGIAVFFWAAVAALISSASGQQKPFGDKVGVIYITGVISSSSGGGPFGDSVASSERIIEDLRTAGQDSSVKAIVLRINSPGGSASASQEVYQEIMRLRRKGTPVIVSMADLAASGGYYIASAADDIYANSGTITGSIGVIMQSTDMSALFKKIGFNPEVVKSGVHKDMFSPNRPLTPEERIMAKTMILDIYHQFVNDVYEARKSKGLSKPELLKIADGRVFTGGQAKKEKLVDHIGTFRDAILAAGKRAGIRGEPTVWRIRRSFWQTLAETRIDIQPKITINMPGASDSSGLEGLKAR